MTLDNNRVICGTNLINRNYSTLTEMWGFFVHPYLESGMWVRSRGTVENKWAT